MAQDMTALITKYSAKAAGTYREFIDATSEAATSTEQNVVVVGQYEQGPFMCPKYCASVQAAHNIFGYRNTKLEAKGCYGMLLAEQMLDIGPIWILNLKNIDQYKETLQVKQYAVNNKEVDRTVSETIATVYDTTKFWKVDPMYGVYGEGPVLSFASVLQDTVTVVVEKYDDSDYMYTVGETKKYNEAFVNDSVDNNDFVNDYLIRVHVFKTDLKKAKLSVPNAIVNGRLNLAVIDAVKNDINAKWFATYTGTVGDLIDINGNNLNIVTKMNADTNASGVHVAINRDAVALNGVDLIGHDALVFNETGEALPTTQQISRIGYIATPSVVKECMYVVDADNSLAYMYGNNDIAVGDVIANEDKYVRVLSKRYVDNVYALPSEAVLGSENYPVTADGQPFTVNADGSKVYPATSPVAGQPVEMDSDSVKWYYEDYLEVPGAWRFSTTVLLTDVAHNIAIKYILNGVEATTGVHTAPTGSAEDLKTALVASLAEITSASGCAFATPTVDVDAKFATDILTSTVVKDVNQLSILAIIINDVSIASSKIDDKSTVASNVATVQSSKLTVNAVAGTVTFNGKVAKLDMTAISEAYGVQTPVYAIQLTEGLTSALTTGQTALLSNGGAYGLSMTTVVNDNPVAVTPYEFAKLNKWNAKATTSAINAIQGIVSLEKHYVNGTAARQNAVLDRLNDNGIMTGFSDPTIFRCRYMIDTFKTYIEPNAKRQYCILASNADRFPVIGNNPFYHELRTSKNPDFHNAIGEFDMSYVAKGSNPDKPSTNSFSWPTAEYAAYYWPYMNVIYDNGFGPTVIPGAGAVGQLYYSKLLSATRKVYDIVAGSGWELTAEGVTGPEFESGPDDRAAMEKMGSNVLQQIGKYTQIRSSKTAYQTTLSAFNYPETLEKCFYISDYVEPTLSGKLFKYNTADARIQVKQKADSGCDIMVADGVVAAYENKCDAENNPAEVRKQGIIVLDTVLYNEYGIRIAVHRTTIKDPEA